MTDTLPDRPKRKNKPGAGRPPLSRYEPSAIVQVAMPESLADKLRRLGGAVWIRDRIKKAKDIFGGEK